MLHREYKGRFREAGLWSVRAASPEDMASGPRGPGGEAHAPKELLKSRVGPQVVQPGIRVEPHEPHIALGVASLQMADCGVHVAETGVENRMPERGHIPTRGKPVQLIEHAERFLPLAGDAEEVPEAGQSGPHGRGSPRETVRARLAPPRISPSARRRAPGCIARTDAPARSG